MKRKLLTFFLGLFGLILFVPTVGFPLVLMWQQAPPISSAHVIRQSESSSTPELIVAPDECETAPALSRGQAVSHQPPCNPALARSGWSISHGGSYAQGSSALPCPTATDSFLGMRIK